MAEFNTLARPYADAVFELAQSHNALAQWSDALAALAAIIANPDTAALMDNPEIDDERLARAIIDVGGSDLGPEAQNLVRLLAENTRLALAPTIAEQYEARRAAVENRIEVSVVSAVALTQAQTEALTKSLEQRLARSVQLRLETDDDMIGGAIIRAGDTVIDGSVRTQLARMRHSLVH